MIHDLLQPQTAAIMEMDVVNQQRDCSHRHVLHRDYEMRSRLALKTAGTERYAADPSTEILCCAYAVDHGPVQLWIPGNPVPPEFIEAADNSNWIVAAHGDHFESAIEHHIMAPRFGWPEIPIERHHCTMTMAAAVGLPARLSAAANALELAERKDAEGERLMQQMSKPRRARQGEDPDQIHWFDDPERRQRLSRYGRRDVAVERAVFNRLPLLSDTEMRCGGSIAASMSAASTSTGSWLKQRGGSPRRPRRRSTPSSPSSPAAPSPASPKSRVCWPGCSSKAVP